MAAMLRCTCVARKGSGGSPDRTMTSAGSNINYSKFDDPTPDLSRHISIE